MCDKEFIQNRHVYEKNPVIEYRSEIKRQRKKRRF